MNDLQKKFLLSLFLVFLNVQLAGCFANRQYKTDFNNTITKSSTYIQNEMVQHQIEGVSVALVHDGKIVWAQGFGEADKEKHIPANADTVYMIGSTAKTLTTVGLLRLFDQKLVGLDDPVINYLPEFKMRDRFAKGDQELTVRRLLNHHSGIPGDIYNGAYVESAWDNWPGNLYTNWLFNYLKDDYPIYIPGEIGSYSNSGFVLAGEILRRKTGSKTFPDAIDATVLKPLGMNTTSFRKITTNLAIGYLEGKPYAHQAGEYNITATGGAYSTVKDMSQLIIMLLNRGKHPNGKLLEPETVMMMGRNLEASSLDIDSYMSFGLGLDAIDDPAMRYAGRAWAKNGSIGFFNAFIEMLPDQDLGGVILSNSDKANLFVYSAAREILRNAVHDLNGLEPTLPTLPEMESETDTGKIVGKYASRGGYDQVVANSDGMLTWLINAHTETPTRKILELKGKTYAVKGGTERIVFTQRQSNGIPHFLMVQYGGSGSEVDNAVYSGNAVYALGEKFTSPAITNAWRQRTNKTYIIDNLPWNELSIWVAPFINLVEKDGVLMGGSMGSQSVLAPENDNLAFLSGSVNRGDSSMRAIQQDGKEKLVIDGFQGYDISLVPPIAIGDVKTEHVDFHKTAWYRFTADMSQRNILFSIAGNDPQYRLRLFNESLIQEGNYGSGSLNWASRPGVWYLAISPTPDATGEFTLSVND